MEFIILCVSRRQNGKSIDMSLVLGEHVVGDDETVNHNCISTALIFQYFSIYHTCDKEKEQVIKLIFWFGIITIVTFVQQINCR